VSSITKPKELREMLRVLVRRLGILERSEASCCGITLAQCHAIVEVGRRGSISVNELAELLNLDKSTVSRSVDNLVNNGYIVRKNDPDDRRYVTLCLTEKGLETYNDVEKGMEEYFSDILSRIPESKREQVIESLSYVINAVQQSKCCPTQNEA